MEDIKLQIQETRAELNKIILEKVKGNLKSNFEAKSKDAAPQSTVTEDTGIATIAQYESPYGSGRSVVAILGDGQDGSYLLNKRLMNPGDLKMVGGGVAILVARSRRDRRGIVANDV